jgi:hypothetical protein
MTRIHRRAHRVVAIGDPTVRGHRRRIALVILGAAAFLALWSILLLVSLPRTFDARRWDVVWFGFDLLLLGPALAWTGWLLYRGQMRAIIGCIACATLLVCDAWFDITTSFGTSALPISILLAVGFELPVAGWFVWMAQRIRHNQILQIFAMLGADPKSIDPGDMPIFEAAG